MSEPRIGKVMNHYTQTNEKRSIQEVMEKRCITPGPQTKTVKDSVGCEVVVGGWRRSSSERAKTEYWARTNKNR